MLQRKVPSEVVSKRQQYVNSMKKFVEDQRSKLQDAMEYLGVSVSHFSELESRQLCPYNQNHVVTETSFKKHIEQCKLLTAGCQKDELVVQLQNYDFAYQDTASAKKVDIDEKTLNKIIWDGCVENGQVYTGQRQLPSTQDEENIYLTAEDRLAVYKHVVRSKEGSSSNASSKDLFDELLTTDWASLVKKGLLDEQNNQEYSSKLEQLAALRDMKRRRQSYRAKNVHINNKSYTEIIRDVIMNQMEILVPPTSSKRNNKSERNDSESRSRDRDSTRAMDKEDICDRHKPYSRSSKDYRRKEGPYEIRHRQADTSDRLHTDRDRLHTDRTNKEHGEDQIDDEYFDRRGRANSKDEEFDRWKSSGRRKRSRSSSKSESGEERPRKSKKSKHKKKHSKKHKYKD